MDETGGPEFSDQQVGKAISPVDRDVVGTPLQGAVRPRGGGGSGGGLFGRFDAGSRQNDDVISGRSGAESGPPPSDFDLARQHAEAGNYTEVSRMITTGRLDAAGADAQAELLAHAYDVRADSMETKMNQGYYGVDDANFNRDARITEVPQELRARAAEVRYPDSDMSLKDRLGGPAPHSRESKGSGRSAPMSEEEYDRFLKGVQDIGEDVPSAASARDRLAQITRSDRAAGFSRSPAYKEDKPAEVPQGMHIDYAHLTSSRAAHYEALMQMYGDTGNRDYREQAVRIIRDTQARGEENPRLAGWRIENGAWGHEAKARFETMVGQEVSDAKMTLMLAIQGLAAGRGETVDMATLGHYSEAELRKMAEKQAKEG